MNSLRGKSTDNLTKTVYDFGQRSEHLVPKAHFAGFFPYLLNRIHLRCVWRKKYMDVFHITDVISFLDIPAPPNGRASYYVHCPCCDESPQKRHLNINLQKDVFRCPRCGASGGMFDLYSLFTGVPRKEARGAIASRIGMPDHVSERKRGKIDTPPAQEYPLTDVETRHATYEALLSKLTLAPDHRENLLRRGLTEREIERLGYKTMPVVGYTSLAKQLHSEGFYLSGVPGFFRTKDNRWTLVHEQRGILIPVRDADGEIQGLQLRRDDAKKRKFRWVSSAEKKDGCHAEGWTHMAGPVRAAQCSSQRDR